MVAVERLGVWGYYGRVENVGKCYVGRGIVAQDFYFLRASRRPKLQL